MSRRRGNISMATRRTYAATLGCCPGASVPIDCGWCGATASLCWGVDRRVVLTDGFEWDHWLPVCRGGNGLLGNIIPTCGPCNWRKGARCPKEFARELFADA